MAADQIKILETADWFYEYADDFKVYSAGRTSFQNAVAVLMGCNDTAQEILVEKYVPKQVQDEVRKVLRQRHH